MTKVLTDPKYYTAIANAIRVKNGSTTTYKPSDMADAITALTASSGTAHTVTLRQTEHQTILATINPSPVSGVSSSSDTVLSLGHIPLTLSVVADTGYTAGNLIINGVPSSSANATVYFDKDYVISAADATAKSTVGLPAEYAYWAYSSKDYWYIVSSTLSKSPEMVYLSQNGKTYLDTTVSRAARAALKRLTPYATTDGATWTTDVTVEIGPMCAFTVPSSDVILVIWAASEADRDLVVASMK